MCGIWALIKKYDSLQSDSLYKNLNNFWNIKNRGPDNSHLMSLDNTFIGFHRLAIMDPSFSSNQPYILHSKDKTIVFICNGEIYNYKELDQKYNLNIGNSDCMSIPSLFIKLEDESEWLELFKETIKGEYAFAMFIFNSSDNKLEKYFIGRDMIGVRPLYCNTNNNIFDIYSSEIKGIDNSETVQEFTPGTIRIVDMIDLKITTFDFTTIYNTIQQYNNTMVYNETLYLDSIRQSVIEAVKLRLCADKPIAFLLSGGVDSSLIASISSNLLGQRIKTFCCGIEGSTDMKYAKLVAQHINSIHTEVYFTEKEGLDAIEDVVRTTETWDTTTIRASVGQYLISKYISQNTDCKVVMVGEGPDEVCSSYLFNYSAPSAESLHLCAEEYIKNIHMYDGKRADRCIARWGMEARIPFLDPHFIKTYWSVPATLRHPKYNIEKYMLRKAFDTSESYLPSEVLWRKKEAFSDGISSKEKSWYTVIQEYIEKKVLSDNIIFDNNITNSTITLEAKYYKMLFRKYFGNNRDMIIPDYWQPKWDKDGNKITRYVDPSARTLNVY